MSASLREGESFVSKVADKNNPLLAIDGVLQTYKGLNFKDVLSLTVPQVILLGHAASVNKERSEEYFDWSEKQKKKTKEKEKKREAQSYGGKHIDEMTSEEYAQYFNF